MTKKSSSKQEDERRQAESRVNRVHGGEIVEAIAPEDLESMNDADCQHKTLVPDPSETEFNAFVCGNPKCSMVFLYDKS